MSGGCLGRLTQVFPGANTSRGFFSFYDQIPTACPEPRLVIVVKGGPGVGKSTLMRRVGHHFLDRGYDVEFHCCSSDNESLDGVVIPDLRFAMLDGTAPHVVDPANPGAVDEILHLGEFWDATRLRLEREAIRSLNAEVARLFAKAYRNLAQARIVIEDLASYYTPACDFSWCNRTASALVKEWFPGEPGSRLGKVRHLFASAITPEGCVNHLWSVVGGSRYIVELTGPPGSGRSTLVGRLAQAAAERGLEVDVFHCSLEPARTETVVVREPGPDADGRARRQPLVAFVGSWVPHVLGGGPAPAPTAVTLSTWEAIDQGKVSRYQDEIGQCEERLACVLGCAVACIRQAKEVHDDLQKPYSEAMDFRALDAVYEGLVKRLSGEAV